MASTTLETVSGDHTTFSDIQVVALQLGNEVYCVDIAHIYTIIQPMEIIRVPKAPPYVNGVINLRGRVIPVVDMRKRFGLDPLPEEKMKAQRIVIVEVEGLIAGMMVDAVTEVLTIPGDAIEPPSLLVTTCDTDCIIGIGRIESKGDDQKKATTRLVILLDVLKTLSTSRDEATALRKLQKAA